MGQTFETKLLFLPYFPPRSGHTQTHLTYNPTDNTIYYAQQDAAADLDLEISTIYHKDTKINFFSHAAFKKK